MVRKCNCDFNRKWMEIRNASFNPHEKRIKTITNTL
jgi:hypothetical protein